MSERGGGILQAVQGMNWKGSLGLGNWPYGDVDWAIVEGRLFGDVVKCEIHVVCWYIVARPKIPMSKSDVDRYVLLDCGTLPTGRDSSFPIAADF